jgi:hypothetical protein
MSVLVMGVIIRRGALAATDTVTLMRTRGVSLILSIPMVWRWRSLVRRSILWIGSIALGRRVGIVRWLAMSKWS